MSSLVSFANFFNTDVRMMMPIMIAAMGIVWNERAGVFNLGVEGIMLMSAFAAYAGSVVSGSVWIGLLFAMAVGALLGLLLAFLAITLRADQTVVGTAINILGAGLSTTLYRVTFGLNGSTKNIEPFQIINIPGLSKIPVIGTMFFSYNALVYLSVIAIIILHWIMHNTKLGLSVRACGENPQACDTLGIHVYRVRYGATIFGGMLCGVAGAYMSTAQLSAFTENMINGRGFIALSAVVFGKYKPLGILMAGLVFGAGLALEVRLSATTSFIPDDILQMIPYALTIIALTGLIGKSRQPAMETVPYVKS